MATINSDRTTETLSERLIERAWIIKKQNALLNKTITKDKKESQLLAPIDWSVLKPQDNEFQEVFSRDTWEKVGVSLSFRNQKMIKEYMSYSYLYSSCIEDAESVDMVAYDYAIAQKILPLISGIGTDFKQDLQELFEKCEGYPVSKSILSDMLKEDKNGMHRYSFFK